MKKLLILLFLSSTQYIMAQQTHDQLKTMFHQFDFWLGKWDVYKFGTDTLAGKSDIQSIIAGVGLLENYTTVDGKYVGKSLNKYNPAKGRWEQYWIDNSGLTLFLSGAFMNGKMVLDDTKDGDEKAGLNQIVWEALSNGTVRQTWNTSNDGGKTWQVVFDGEYKKSKS